MAKDIQAELKKLSRLPTKSAKIAELLRLGFSKSDVSKAVPANYSQVHSIDKSLQKELGQDRAREQLKGVDVGKMKPHEVADAARGSSSWGAAAKTPSRKSSKPVQSPLLEAVRKGDTKAIEKLGRAKIGKLRTPGLPSDTAVGECVNCGFDLVIHLTREGYVFKHVNISTEEYLSEVQFCHGVPKVLIA